MLKRPILYVIQGFLTVCVSGDNMWRAKLTIDLSTKLNRRVFSESCKQRPKYVFYAGVGVGGGSEHSDLVIAITWEYKSARF